MNHRHTYGLFSNILGTASSLFNKLHTYFYNAMVMSQLRDIYRREHCRHQGKKCSCHE